MNLQVPIFLIILAVAGCSHDDTTQNAVEAIGSEVWWEYSDSQGRFQVLIPGEPEYATHDMPTPFGGTMKFHNIMVHMNRNTKLFYVTYVDYPIGMKPEDESGVVELIDRYVMGAAKKKNLQLQQESKITINDYPGAEYLFADPAYGDKSLWRVYFVNNRLYQLISSWAPDQDHSSKDAEKFLNSFKLTH